MSETPAEWFTRTQHCHGCGQPGNFCLCTTRRPCGCRDLHQMGSGIDANAPDVFAASVPDGQEELF